MGIPYAPNDRATASDPVLISVRSSTDQDEGITGYAGRHLQTIRFLREDRNWLQENWNAGVDLVASAPVSVNIRGNHVLKDVDVEHVRKFLQTYRVHETNSSMRQEDMLAFIQRSLEKDHADILVL